MRRLRLLHPRAGLVVQCVLAAALVAALGACSGDDDDNTTTGSVRTTTTKPSTTSTSGAAATTSTVATTTTVPCPDAPAPTPVTSAPTENAVLLRAVALTIDACTDRVTLTFSAKTATVPGYRVEYQPGPITSDGAGEPVAVAGTAFLVVRLEPAYGFDFDTGVPSYTGPDRLPAPGAHHVREVVKTGDFEAVMTWVIGVDAERPFTVTPTSGTAPTLTITIS